MARLKFGITFKPRNIQSRSDLLIDDIRRQGDKSIKVIRRLMKFEMIAAAPGPGQPGPFVSKTASLAPRTGRLKRGITALPIKQTRSGRVDRRAKITVESRSPHTRFVIRGVSAREGEGAKGKGRFDAVIGKRMRFGLYPGFKGYDFIEVASRRINKQLAKQGIDEVNTYRKFFRKRFGGS